MWGNGGMHPQCHSCSVQDSVKKISLFFAAWNSPCCAFLGMGKEKSMDGRVVWKFWNVCTFTVYSCQVRKCRKKKGGWIKHFLRFLNLDENLMPDIPVYLNFIQCKVVCFKHFSSSQIQWTFHVDLVATCFQSHSFLFPQDCCDFDPARSGRCAATWLGLGFRRGRCGGNLVQKS